MKGRLNILVLAYSCKNTNLTERVPQTVFCHTDVSLVVPGSVEVDVAGGGDETGELEQLLTHPVVVVLAAAACSVQRSYCVVD